MASPLPQTVWQVILAFCSEGKTGSIRLDVKDGQVCAWQVTEVGHVKRYNDANITRET